MQDRFSAPQWASKNLDLAQWGIDQDEIDILTYGPMDDEYWQIWQKTLKNAKTKINGVSYGLYECSKQGVLIMPDDFDLQTRDFLPKSGNVAD